MLDYYQTNLFKDISMDEYKRLLSCLEAREKRFSAGETICSYDSGFGDLGIIGTGTACVVRSRVVAVWLRMGSRRRFWRGSCWIPKILC